MSYLSSPEKEREILNLESRRKVYEVVKKYSGCSFHDLERKSSVAAGTLQYHLHYLAKYGLITIEKDGNKMRYFAKDMPEKERKLLAVLRQKNNRLILVHLINQKSCAQKELAKMLAVSPSTISWYMARLVKERIVKSVKKQGEVHYSLAGEEAEIMALLITYKESFFDKVVDQTIEMWAFR